MLLQKNQVEKCAKMAQMSTPAWAPEPVICDMHASGGHEAAEVRNRYYGGGHHTR